jgi:peptidoglycan/LPS O-acetylase OafA/YrhL
MFSFNTFRRVTSGKPILEEIDGLRFLAIFYVIIAHIYYFFYAKTPFFKAQITQSRVLNVVRDIAQDGQHGVAIFFVISGFILGLPFANHYLNNYQKVSLKKFYLRRVTRLEPPYIIVLLILSVAILLKNLSSFNELFPHLVASLTYTHNIVFNSMSSITPVAWSLEVEVQFYLLAPLLGLVFKIQNFFRRLLVLGAAIIFVAFLQEIELFKSSFALSMSLLGWFQYFLVGFILADIYASKKIQIKIHLILEIVLGLTLLYCLSVLPYKGNISSRLLYPVFCLVFFILVLHFPFWKKVFSLKFISIVGGMCYSIYLLHFATISFIGNYTLKYKIGDSLLVNYVFQALLFLGMILCVSAAYFILIEKPCMRKDWPSRLLKKVNPRLSLVPGIIKKETVNKVVKKE